MRRRRDELADELGLTALLGRKLSTLSAGEQQLTALAAAVAHEPALVILDEPTANLSAANLEVFLAALRRLRSTGTSVVIAEHRVHLLGAERNRADQVAYLRDGRVAESWTGAEFAALSDATLEELKLRPRPVQTGPPVTEPPPRSSIGDGVSIRGLRCRLARERVISYPDLDFAAGTVTAIRGPNGAGKTTLLRILAGLQSHDGHVLHQDRPTKAKERRRATALVVQEVQRQLFSASVEDELRSVARPATAAQISRALESFDLAALAERHPLALSGGQQQRLAVASALASERPVVLLDEPSTGLDAAHLGSITTALRQMAHAGRTVIVVSHDDDLLAIADVVLDLGASGATPRWVAAR